MVLLLAVLLVLFVVLLLVVLLQLLLGISEIIRRLFRPGRSRDPDPVSRVVGLFVSRYYVCRYLHVDTCVLLLVCFTCVSLLDHLCMASMNLYIFLCMASTNLYIFMCICSCQNNKSANKKILGQAMPMALPQFTAMPRVRPSAYAPSTPRVRPSAYDWRGWLSRLPHAPIRRG
jgi:hypothetical protein